MALPLTSLTGHYDASTSAKLWKTFVSGGPHTGVPVDGNTIAVWEHQQGANLIFKQFSSDALPVWRQATPLLPLPCLDFAGVGSTQRMVLTNNTNVAQALSALITTTAFTLLIAFYAEAVSNTLDNYQTHTLIGDSGGYWGAFIGISSGVPKILAYNYDGTQDYVRLAVSVGAPHVLMVRHESGSLYAALDGGAETSVASGTTGSVANNVFIGQSSTVTFDGRIGEIAVYNAALTGTTLTDAVSYFTAKWLAAPAVATTQAVVIFPV